MSLEKARSEAARWLETAEQDLDTAILLKEHGRFAHACFHAQQAGEKAMKAVWYHCDADPWGHSVRRLIEDLENVDLNLYEQLKAGIRAGNILDRFYIPTRYPNGLPDLTPGEAYLDEDAASCIQYAGEIVAAVRTLLPCASGKTKNIQPDSSNQE
jgi:HEPN domain-containing protein